MAGLNRAETGSGVKRAVTSSAQDGLWLLDRLAAGSPAHNLSRAYRITGDLEVATLRAAWRAVVRRHEILRTTLVEFHGRLIQQIAPGIPPSFTDAGTVAEAEVERVCTEWATTGFDLANGPVARLTVARLGEGEHLVVLVLHRTVADEPSLSVLVDELSAHYASAAPPEPPLQFADYARRQRDRSDTPEFRRLLDWWTGELTPLPPALTLPADRARPAGPSLTGGTLRFDWGADFGRALATVSEATGTTPFSVLLAGYQALLHRYGGEDRVPVGVPVTVRPRPEFERLIGPFTNPLVLCADLSGEPTFRELLGRVARLVRAGLDHRELPFDDLVRVLNPDRDPRRVPFCDAVFAFRQEPRSDLVLPGATVRRQPVETGLAGTDLTLTIESAWPAVTGSLEYRGGLFDPASAEAMLGQLRTLLAAALAEPDLPVSALPLDGPDRIRAAVRAADRITGAASPERTVAELVHGWARRRPEAPAVAWDGETVSYRELEARAARVTAALRSLGGVEGSAVVVRMPSGPVQAAALLGVLDAGAHLVCLGTDDSGERGRAVLADVRPACLLLDGERPGDDLVAWYRAELHGRVLDLATLDDDAPAGPVRACALDERAYIAYTSGSTGRPKGIAQTHATLAQFVTWLAGQFGVGPGSRMAQWAAPGYDASLCEVFAALTAGATLCPVPERTRVHPEKLADWLAAERISLFQTVPSFARELLRVVTKKGTAGSLAALDHLLLAGEPVPGELANGLRSVLPFTHIVNLYGPTESILATWHEITEVTYGTVPIGRSIPGRQVLVLDDLDRPCPAGVTGHIVIRSPYVVQGYFGGPAGAGEAFRPLRGLEEFGPERAGCYRTGDLGRRRWDGLLEFRGRRDFQVKFYGTRVELTDIEAALAAHDSVAECAVIAVPDRDGLVTRLVAYVVPRRTPDGAVASPDVWRSHLHKRFGRSKLPVSFKTLTAMPRNVGGKVDRRRLPDPDPYLAQSTRMPRTRTEKELAAIWSDLLGTEQISIDHTFFELGGHSLLLPVLLDRIRARTGAGLPLWECFAHPTLAGLAARVDTRNDPRSAPEEQALPNKGAN